jgi:hypothetical protein
MAIERNFTGFEFADGAELNYGNGGAISGARNAFPNDGTARSGTRYLQQTAATNAANLVPFAAGSIVGTSGTVISPNHKRVSVRAYFRIDSYLQNGQIRIFGFGNDTGTCTVQFGAQNSSGGFLQAGTKIGLRIGSQSHNSGAVGAYPWGTVDLSTATWYRLLLDIDINMATLLLSATLRITDDSTSPAVDFTLTNSATVASDNIDKLAFGYSNAAIGSFARTANVSFDDVVYIGTSDSDAASGQPTLPTQTHIYAIVPPTGAASNTGWSGTYADVDEYPVSGADTMSSSTAGAEVDFSHATGIALGYSQIQAMKLYLNALVSTAGTGVVDYLLNGTAKAATLTSSYPSTNGSADPIGGVLFSTMTPAAFSATTFGIRKNNGTQTTVLANIGLEVIGTLAAYGSGNQIRGETQIKAGSIYDAQIADTAAIQRHKIVGLSDGPLPVFVPEDPVGDDWLIPGPPGAPAALVRIPVIPVFFPEDPADDMPMGAGAGGSGSSVSLTGYVKADGTVPFTADQSMGVHKLTSVTDPTAAQDAATKNYVDQFLGDLASKVYRATNQSFTHNTDAAVSFSNAQFDPDSKWAVSPNPTRVTVQTAGKYCVVGQVKLDVNFSGICRIRVKKNGSFVAEHSQVGGGSSSNEYAQVAYVDSFAAADYVELFVTLELAAGSGTFSIVGSTANETSLSIFKAGGAGTSGGQALLYTSTAAASSSIDAATRNAPGQSGALFQSDYDEYIVELVNIVPATASVQVLMRLSTDGGVTYDSSAIYDYVLNFSFGSTTGSARQSAATAFGVRDTNTTLTANTAYNATYKLFGPAAALYKTMIGQGSVNDSGIGPLNLDMLGYYKNTTAVNALRVIASSGNLTSGTLRIYGVDKSGGGGTAAVAGALTVSADAAITSPVNLTTVGTFDWGAPTNNTTPLQLQTAPYPNRKLNGRAQPEFYWIYAGGAGMTAFTGAVGATISATAADNMAQSALSAFGTGAMIFTNTAAVVGYGFALRVRAGKVSRTMRFGARMWSGIYTLVAHLSDGSAVDVTKTYDTGAGAGTEREWTITYNAANDNEFLTILFTLTTNRGSGPHVGLVYFTVA